MDGFKPGDKVMALGNKAYAELAVVDAKDVALVPEKLDLVKAAALPLVTQTGRAVDFARDEDSGWADGAGERGGWERGTVGGVDGEEGGREGDCGGEEVSDEGGGDAGSGPGSGAG